MFNKAKEWWKKYYPWFTDFWYYILMVLAMGVMMFFL